MTVAIILITLLLNIIFIDFRLVIILVGFAKTTLYLLCVYIMKVTAVVHCRICSPIIIIEGHCSVCMPMVYMQLGFRGRIYE